MVIRRLRLQRRTRVGSGGTVVVVGKQQQQQQQQSRISSSSSNNNNNTTTTRTITTICLWILLFCILFLPFVFIQQSNDHILMTFDFDLTFKATILNDFSTTSSTPSSSSSSSASSSSSSNLNGDIVVFDVTNNKEEEMSPSKKQQSLSLLTTTTTTTTTTTATATIRNHPKNFTCSTSATKQEITLPQIPNFIIAGAQKCGTTALQQFLSEHPNIQVSSTKEPHYFDWYYPSGKTQDQWYMKHNLSKATTTDSQLLCSIQETYFQDHFASNYTYTTTPDTTNPQQQQQQQQHHHHHPLLYFEKTPSYLFLSDVPERISSTCPWGVKIILMLRNPIDRAYSQYRMSIRTKGKTFEELIDEEVESLNLVGLSHAPTLSTYLREQQQQQQHHNYTSLNKTTTTTTTTTSTTVAINGSGSTTSGGRGGQQSQKRGGDQRFSIFEHIKSNESDNKLRNWKHYRRMFTNNYLQRGMYILQLRQWKKYFKLKDTLLVLRYEAFVQQPQQVFDEILDFLQLPKGFVPTQGFDTRHNTITTTGGDKNKPIQNKTRAYLDELFRPYNELLADEMGEEWRNVW